MGWTCLSNEKRRARKPYGCILCGQRIEAKSIYIYRTGVEGGDFCVTRMHPECDAATSDWDELDFETFEIGSLPRPRADDVDYFRATEE